MRELTQLFATSLLDHARTSYELEVMLNYNPETADNWEPGERQTLDRLKLAIKYKQKQVKLFMQNRENEESRNQRVFFPTRISFFLTVRGSSKRPTIASSNLVRRSAWFPKVEHGWATNGSGKTRRHVPGLQFDLHALADLENGSFHEEAFRQIHLSFLVLRFFSQ